MQMLETLLKGTELVSGLVDDQRRKKVNAAMDQAAAEYVAQRGQPARAWLHSEIEKLLTEEDVVYGFVTGPTPLDADTIATCVDHIANGHITMLKDLLYPVLLQRGYKIVDASGRSLRVMGRLFNFMAGAAAAGPQAETGASGKYDEKAAEKLTKITIGNTQRLICPHCYRVIREWDPFKNAPFYAPAQVQCKDCHTVLLTPFKSWSRSTGKEKVTNFLFPALFIIAGVLILILAQDYAFRFGGGIAVCIGIFWAASLWKQGQQSLTIPVW